jgi:predicted chitinase
MHRLAASAGGRRDRRGRGVREDLDSTRLRRIYDFSSGLNKLADSEGFTTITRRINGGLTGLPERERYYETAKKALDVGGRE